MLDFKYNIGQVLKLTHDSGNIYYGEVINIKNRLYARTKFFNWHISLTYIDNPKMCQFKSCEIVGQMPQDSSLLELPQETFDYIANLGKMTKYTDVKEYFGKNKKE